MTSRGTSFRKLQTRHCKDSNYPPAYKQFFLKKIQNILIDIWVAEEGKSSNGGPIWNAKLEVLR